jgi:hypothetical protein
MLKIHLKCNNYNNAFCDWFALSLCHTKFRKKSVVCSPPPENFDIFKVLGPYFWRFLKQIRKRIGCKLTAFYKNAWLSFHKNNDFITQIFTENIRQILTWIVPEFHSWWEFTAPTPPPDRCVPLYIYTYIVPLVTIVIINPYQEHKLRCHRLPFFSPKTLNSKTYLTKICAIN